MIDVSKPLKLRSGAKYFCLAYFPDNEDKDERILGVYSLDNVNWYHIWHTEDGAYYAYEPSAMDLIPLDE